MSYLFTLQSDDGGDNDDESEDDDDDDDDKLIATFFDVSLETELVLYRIAIFFQIFNFIVISMILLLLLPY